jgi:hypothetical protein
MNEEQMLLKMHETAFWNQPSCRRSIRCNAIGCGKLPHGSKSVFPNKHQGKSSDNNSSEKLFFSRLGHDDLNILRSKEKMLKTVSA